MLSIGYSSILSKYLVDRTKLDGERRASFGKGWWVERLLRMLSIVQTGSVTGERSESRTCCFVCRLP